MIPTDLIVKISIVLSVVAAVTGSVWYVSNLQAKLAQSQENVHKLEDGIKDQKILMQQMRQDISKIQSINDELRKSSEKYRSEVEALSRKFSQDAQGQSRDFGLLAREKPELIERLVNRGSRNAARCLEIASGAPRTKEEIEAKTSSEINKECPAIANPNYRAPQ